MKIKFRRDFALISKFPSLKLFRAISKIYSFLCRNISTNFDSWYLTNYPSRSHHGAEVDSLMRVKICRYHWESFFSSLWKDFLCFFFFDYNLLWSGKTYRWVVISSPVMRKRDMSYICYLSRILIFQGHVERLNVIRTFFEFLSNRVWFFFSLRFQLEFRIRLEKLYSCSLQGLRKSNYRVFYVFATETDNSSI